MSSDDYGHPMHVDRGYIPLGFPAPRPYTVTVEQLNDRGEVLETDTRDRDTYSEALTVAIDIGNKAYLAGRATRWTISDGESESRTGFYPAPNAKPATPSADPKGLTEGELAYLQYLVASKPAAVLAAIAPDASTPNAACSDPTCRRLFNTSPGRKSQECPTCGAPGLVWNAALSRTE